MTMKHHDVVSCLNELIETCKDGQKGFLDAAEHVKGSDLKTLCMRCSQQRSEFAGELQQVVQRLGADAETTGSMAGAMHRRWIDVKSAITGRDDDAIISECERGEDVAVSSYREALEKDLPSDVRSVVESQYRKVKEVHDQFSHLKHAGVGH